MAVAVVPHFSAGACTLCFFNYPSKDLVGRRKGKLLGQLDQSKLLLSSSKKHVKERSIPANASNSQEKEETSLNDIPALSEDSDLNYLWKLGAGSVIGAAIIKYGSILFPDITRPNLIQALIMISTPVVVVTVILIKQSRSD